MELKINIYRVEMYDCTKMGLRKSKTVYATTGEEAVNKVKDESWWHETGTGYDYREIKYPIILKAVLYNGR